MSFKKLITLSSALFAAAAFAQAAIGTVGNVQGIVTVTDGVTGGTAKAGAPITNGMRFVTTSSGSATLQVRGCTVTLAPNQAVTVLQSMSCDQLVAAVQRVGGPVVAGAGGSAITGALGVSGILVANAAYARHHRNNRSISSN